MCSKIVYPLGRWIIRWNRSMNKKFAVPKVTSKLFVSILPRKNLMKGLNATSWITICKNAVSSVTKKDSHWCGEIANNLMQIDVMIKVMNDVLRHFKDLQFFTILLCSEIDEQSLTVKNMLMLKSSTSYYQWLCQDTLDKEGLSTW